MRMCTITGVEYITRVYNEQLVSRKSMLLYTHLVGSEVPTGKRVNHSRETCVVAFYARINTYEANTPMACAATAAELEELS